MFVFGNAVLGGMIGTNPVIPKEYKMNDDLPVQFDYRQIYSSILNQWMGSPTSNNNQILYREFEKIQLIKDTFADSDSDGVPDLYDQCANTPLGTLVDINGCPVFSVPTNNYTIQATATSCPGTKNGALQIAFKDTKFTYFVDIKGPAGFAKSLKSVAGTKQSLDNLEIGNYNLSISIEGQKEYVQLFDIQIKQPAPLIVQASTSPDQQTMSLALQGAESYFIQVNSKTVEVKESSWSIDLEKGNNKIRVWTSQDCQGVFNREIFRSEQIQCFPNPCMGPVNVYVAGKDSRVEITLYDFQGRQLSHDNYTLDINRMAALDLSHLPAGSYLLEAKGQTVQQQIKLMKL
jgi:hypothetical protein